MGKQYIVGVIVIILSAVVVDSFISLVTHENPPSDTGRSYEAEYRYEAEIAFRQGDYLKAIGYFDRLIELHPDDVYLIINRGDAYRHMVQYEASLEDYTTAVNIIETLGKKPSHELQLKINYVKYRLSN